MAEKAVDKVPLLDLRRVPESLDNQMIDTFTRVLKSGQYILGPEVEGLEKECAAYCGTKHALGLSSGTDALIVALLALGIGPGDEVICPTYTFFATAGAIWRTGARPVFVDVDEKTFNTRADLIERAITAKTKAIVPVHLFGQCAEMEGILALARARKVRVIEDAAQAIGADNQGRRAGSMGDIGCFSFFPSKNLGALGDAGFVTTQDDALQTQMRMIRVHGGASEYHHAMVGGNFRIDALQAALIRVKLPLLEDATQRRQKNAALYTALLQDLPLELPKATTGRHIFNQFVVVTEQRDALQEHLKSKNVATKVYYPVPLHLQACFAELRHQAGDLPNAERLAKTSLALPIFPELREEEIRYCADAIRSFFR
jgi:dTDP-4-amino-4,6-dideoxygalactose transaminase